MSLKDELIKVSENFPAELKEQRDGSLAMKFVIAERKAFLSKKKLTYKCKARVNDDKKKLPFLKCSANRTQDFLPVPALSLKKRLSEPKEKNAKAG